MAVSLWAFMTYVSTVVAYEQQLMWVRLVIGSAAFMMYVIYLNFLVFPALALKSYTTNIKVVTGYFLVTLLLTQSPFVFKSLAQNADGSVAPEVGPAIIVFSSFVIFTFLSTAYRLLSKYRKADFHLKRQLRYIIFGLVTTISCLIVTNFMLPNIWDNTSLIKYGPAFTLLFTISFAYALARHRLFDVSSIVLRSFVYTFTTAFLVSIYSAVSLTIKSYLVSANISTNVTTMAEIGLLAIFGISFYPLRLYFDRLTTKIFFRNHYNTHQLIRTINNILAQSVDLAKMLHKITNLLKSSMLVEYTAFLLIEAERTREIGAGKLPADMEAIIGLQKYFTKKRNVLVVDQLDSEKIDKDLMAYLQAQKVSVVVRLEKLSQDKRVESEGYLIIGKKQSGKSINSQDERLLETISGHLAAAIQNLVHLDEITGFNEKLQHEVADATKELKVKNSKLKQLDHNKDEFVSMASHQLRTPLTSVKGYLSMVLDGDAGELKPAQRQLLEQAYTSTQRMVFLIADLLNLSRLNSGKFVISPEPTSLAAIIEGEIKQVQKTAELKGLKVSFFCDPSIPNLQLDQMKIRQVIMNFIDNAIYYTPEGGAINISLRKDGKTAVFSVIDNGMGVPKTEQKELFNKFYRGSNARKSRPDGTGLGLYMAKKVIDAQGGKIVFQSREDEGSTFGFSFDLNPKA